MPEPVGPGRWVSVGRDVDVVTSRHRHLVRRGALTSACGSSASAPEVWEPNTRKLRCPQCLARAEEKRQQHRLRLGRKPGGSRTFGTGGPLYSTTGRCSCGWEGKDNNAPSAGGRAGVIALHEYQTGSKAVVA